MPMGLEMTKKFSFGKLLQLRLFQEMIIKMACQDVARSKEELTWIKYDFQFIFCSEKKLCNLNSCFFVKLCTAVIR